MWFRSPKRANAQAFRNVDRHPADCCPEGACENSPTLWRWERGVGQASPEGTTEGLRVHFNPIGRPFGTSAPSALNPTLKRWAILKMSLRDKDRRSRDRGVRAALAIFIIE